MSKKDFVSKTDFLKAVDDINNSNLLDERIPTKNLSLEEIKERFMKSLFDLPDEKADMVSDLVADVFNAFVDGAELKVVDEIEIEEEQETESEEELEKAKERDNKIIEEKNESKKIKRDVKESKVEKVKKERITNPIRVKNAVEALKSKGVKGKDILNALLEDKELVKHFTGSPKYWIKKYYEKLK